MYIIQCKISKERDKQLAAPQGHCCGSPVVMVWFSCSNSASKSRNLGESG